MCEYRLPTGKYHAVRHITCAFGANIDLLEYPLIHRRRDDGPPSPPCFAIGGRLVWVWLVDAPAEPPAFSQSSAEPSGQRSVWNNGALYVLGSEDGEGLQRRATGR